MAETLRAVDAAFAADPAIDEVDIIVGLEAAGMDGVVVVDHKLGIALALAGPLYEAAYRRFVGARRALALIQARTSSTRGTPEGLPGFVGAVAVADGDSEAAIEAALVSGSRVLCLLNGFEYTAYNERKRLLQRGRLCHAAELGLLNLTLTKHPKSDFGWAHRRWVLRDLATARGGGGGTWGGHGVAGLRATAEAELAFCTEAAKRHPKNYQSWTHRQWVHAWEAGATIETGIAPRGSAAAATAAAASCEREPPPAPLHAGASPMLASAADCSLLEYDFRATLAWTRQNISDCCSFHHIIHLVLLACARDNSGRSAPRTVAQEAGVTAGVGVDSTVPASVPANEDSAAAVQAPVPAAPGMGVNADAMCVAALRHGCVLTAKYG